MLDSLTEREQEILNLVAQGLSNSEIAQQLFLSRGTVKAHTHNIYSKLGVANRAQALLKAEELGLTTAARQAVQPLVNGGLPSSDISTQLTPFIGRKTELARLAAMLDDQRMRLITILGAGGMGKTRLAIEVLEQHAHAFQDGQCFIALARIADAKNLASTIIESIGLRFQGSEPPDQQLLAFLRDKNALLVLDNFEHLLDGVDLITAMLHEAPNIKILVTSRERLNLSAEVVFVLGGLDYAVDAGAQKREQGEAVQLLLERAQFVNPVFELHADDAQHLRRICQITQGMPLALILAAGWLDMMTLAEVAAELAQSIDFLEHQLTDLPVRQRSIRAVIMSSWNRLNAEEKSTFVNLSVFRGGFTREAAQPVTGASLQVLRTLLNRSFITFHEGRYQVHELLRQFAEQELLRDPDQHQRVQALHADYFAAFLYARVKMAYTSQQQQHIDDVRVELDNVRAAWKWAVDCLSLDTLQRMVETIASFWHEQSRYLEGIALFEDTIHALDQAANSDARNLLIAIMSTDLGWYHMRLGKLDHTEAYFTQAHTLFKQLNFPHLHSTTDPLVGLAFVASIRGDYARATEIAERALEQYERLQDYANQAYAYYALTGIKLAQGEYEQARDYGIQAVATCDKARDRWLRAYCLIELGNVARAMGDDDTAARHYQASYAIREEFNDPEGMAAALNQLGQLALRRQDFVEAERLFQQSHEIYQTVHDQGGIATVLHGLGQVALASGDHAAGRDHLYHALHMANEIEYIPLLFAILLTVAELRLETGRDGDGLNLLSFVQQHPSSSQETKDKAQQILNPYQHAPAAHTPRASLPIDLAAVVAIVLADLSTAA